MHTIIISARAYVHMHVWKILRVRVCVCVVRACKRVCVWMYICYISPHLIRHWLVSVCACVSLCACVCEDVLCLCIFLRVCVGVYCLSVCVKVSLPLWAGLADTKCTFQSALRCHQPAYKQRRHLIGAQHFPFVFSHDGTMHTQTVTCTHANKYINKKNKWFNMQELTDTQTHKPRWKLWLAKAHLYPYEVVAVKCQTTTRLLKPHARRRTQSHKHTRE